MKYRADIQMLRGFSALVVVGYHLTLSGFQSGFLGVDIFFTISGFLMAIFYAHGQATDFFRRRALRILPAYFATVLLALIGASLVLLPLDLHQVAEQSAFAAFLASNIGFWLHNSYFEQSEFPLLLHLWSLGVELQFYVLVPLIAMASSRSRLALPALFTLSLALCLLVTGISPKTSFFMMPLRLWEFAIGFGVAQRFSDQGNVRDERWTWLGALAAVALIALVVTSTDIRATSAIYGHPGLRALAATIFAALILLFGLPTSLSTSLFGRTLELVGKYSYSIYMVHFPLILLFTYQPYAVAARSVTSTPQKAALLALSLGAAAALYHLVEAPARAARSVVKWLWAAPMAILVVALVLPSVQRATYSSEELTIFDAATDRAPYRCGKLARLLHPTAISCELTGLDTTSASALLLVGNSHADSIKTAFAAVASALGVRVWFLVDNQPLMSGGLSPAQLVEEATRRRVGTIVLHFSPNTLRRGTIRQVVALAEMRGMRVSLMLPVPVWNRSVPEVLWRHLELGAPLPEQTLSTYQASNADLLAETGQIQSAAFERYDVAPSFCRPACAMTTASGVPLYFDDGHLTLTGAAMLRPLFSSVINDAIARARVPRAADPEAKP